MTENSVKFLELLDLPLIDDNRVSLYIDTINNKIIKNGCIEVGYREDIEIRGWAVDAYSQQLLAKLFLRLDDSLEFFEPTEWYQRQEVVDLFGNPSFSQSGFFIRVPWHLIKQGKHTITLFLIGTDGKYQLQPQAYNVIVGELDIRFANRYSEEWDYQKEREWLSKVPYLAKSEEPFVTIIMPAKNRGELIKRAIDSVRRQEYSNWELLAIDDSSTDNTKKVIQSYSARDGRVRLIENCGAGVATARNTGLNSAKGDYVAFLDTDNEWTPRFLTNMIALMKKRNIEVAYSAEQLVDDHETPSLWRDKLFLAYQGDITSLMLYSHIDINSLVIERKFIERGPRFDIYLKKLEDWDYAIELAKISNPVLLPFVGVVYHTDAPDRMTTSNSLNWTNAVWAKHVIDWNCKCDTKKNRISVVTILLDNNIDYQVASLQSALKDADCNGLDIEVLVLYVEGKEFYQNDLHSKLNNDSRITFYAFAIDFGRTVILNFGINKATGEYILLLDGNIVLMQNSLVELKHTLDTRKSLGVQALITNEQNAIYSAGIKYVGNSALPVHDLCLHPKECISTLLCRQQEAVSTLAFLTRREILFATKGFNPLFTSGWEDADLCKRIREVFVGDFFIQTNSHAEIVGLGIAQRFDYESDNQRLFLQDWR